MKSFYSRNTQILQFTLMLISLYQISAAEVSILDISSTQGHSFDEYLAAGPLNGHFYYVMLNSQQNIYLGEQKIQNPQDVSFIHLMDTGGKYFYDLYQLRDGKIGVRIYIPPSSDAIIIINPRQKSANQYTYPKGSYSQWAYLGESANGGLVIPSGDLLHHMNPNTGAIISTITFEANPIKTQQMNSNTQFMVIGNKFHAINNTRTLTLQSFDNNLVSQSSPIHVIQHQCTEFVTQIYDSNKILILCKPYRDIYKAIIKALIVDFNGSNLTQLPQIADNFSGAGKYSIAIKMLSNTDFILCFNIYGNPIHNGHLALFQNSNWENLQMKIAESTNGFQEGPVFANVQDNNFMISLQPKNYQINKQFGFLTSYSTTECLIWFNLRLEALDNVGRESWDIAATWSSTSDSFKENDLNNWLKGQGRKKKIEIPIEFFELGKKYTITASYNNINYPQILSSFKCGDSFTGQSLSVSKKTPADACSPLKIEMILSASEQSWRNDTTNKNHYIDHYMNPKTTDSTNYLQNQAKNKLNFELGTQYLLPLTTYTFTAKTVTGSVATQTYTTDKLLDFTPYIPSTLHSNEDIIIDLQYMKCVPTLTNTQSISQKSGPTIDRTPWLSNGIVTIPSCELYALADYEFEVITYYDGYQTGTTITKDIVFSTQSEKFTIDVQQAESDQYDLNLTTTATYTSQCPGKTNTSHFNFAWTCTNYTTSSIDIDNSAPCSFNMEDYASQADNVQVLAIPNSLRQYSIAFRLKVEVSRGTVKETQELLIHNYKIEIKPYVHDASCAVTLVAEVTGIDKASKNSFEYNWEILNPTPTNDQTTYTNSIKNQHIFFSNILITDNTAYQYIVQYTTNLGIVVSDNKTITSPSGIDKSVLFNIHNNSCLCPNPKIVKDLPKQCRTANFTQTQLVLIEVDSSAPCTDIKLTLTITQEERDFLNPIAQEITWIMTSNASVANANLNNHMVPADKTKTERIIPVTLLHPHVQYTFLAKTKYNTVSNEFTISLSQDTFQIRPYYKIESNVITTNKCVPSIPYSAKITALEGSAQPQNFNIDSVKNIITIPKCDLTALHKHQLSLEVFYVGFEYSTFPILLQADVLTEEYTLNASHYNYINFDASILSGFQYTEKCPQTDRNQLTFTWSCKFSQKNEGPFEKCPDQGLEFFDKPLTESDILIPSRVRQTIQIFEFSLIVKRGDITKHLTYKLENSYVIIHQVKPVSRCGISLEAEISPYERNLTNSPSFNWYLKSSTHTQNDIKVELDKYLLTIKTLLLFIPHYFIEPRVYYTFGVWYTNFVGLNITDFHSLDAIIPDVPKISIVNGRTQKFFTFQVNFIKAQFECQPKDMHFNWQFKSGPSVLNLDQYTVEKIPTWIKIPECKLEMEKTYIIELITTHQLPNIQTITPITLNTDPDSYVPMIEGGNKDHPETKDLTLEAKIIRQGSCAFDMALFKFTWSCEVGSRTASSMDSCNDIDSTFFGIETTKTKITIGNTNLQLNTRMKFTLIVTKGSTSKTTTSQVMIKGPSVIPFSIECISSICTRYSVGEVNFKAISEDKTVKYDKLNYLWSIEPAIPKTTFTNEMALLPNNQNLQQQFIYLSLTTNNATNLGYAQYQMLINHPPKSGQFKVEPTYGSSIKTLFKLKASDWIDEDLPLQYQFSYAKENNNGDQTILSTKSANNSIETLLSSSSVNETIIIFADIFDSFDCKANTSQQIIVNSGDLKKIDEAVDKIQNVLQSINELSDPQKKVEQLTIVSEQLKGLGKETQLINQIIVQMLQERILIESNHQMYQQMYHLVLILHQKRSLRNLKFYQTSQQIPLRQMRSLNNNRIKSCSRYL